MRNLFLLTTSLLLTAITAPAQSIGLTGNGTETNPYLINDKDDLTTLASAVNNSTAEENAGAFSGTYFRLEANIDMDGVEFLKRSSEICPDTIRLLVTAYSDVEILMNAINYAKIYRYIKKPYSPEELLHIVQLALEYYQLKEDNRRLIIDLKDLFSGTINAIMDALDSKDSYTLGRSRRVAFYTTKIIAAMDISKSEKAAIELAALLHDIGMIGVQEEILHKVEKLTPEEREEIRKHVLYSVKILEDIKQLDRVTEIIKYHHEFYNGEGYPFGKKGDEIPLGARIIAIADAYDSLVSFRPYRDGLTPEDALNRLKEQKGKQFDPNLFEIFESIVDDANKEWDKLNPYLNGENSQQA